MKTWHKIVISVIIAVGILVSVKSCIDRKTPDITLAYIGDGFINRVAFEENASILHSLCNDIDSNGEINIDIMEISFHEELCQADRQNSTQKLMHAVGAGAARVYFIEEKYVMNNASSGVFADLSHLGSGFKNSEGEVVAISIKGNEKAKMLGVDTNGDIYLAVRIVSEVDSATDKHIEAKHNSAMNIAEYILN